MELVRGVLRLLPHEYAIDDRLREIGYGHWEGSTLPEMQVLDPELFAKRQSEKWTVSPPGGESYVAVQARMNEWYRELTVDTVAVAHGGTARALVGVLGFETPPSAAALTIGRGGVGGGGERTPRQCRRPDHRAGRRVCVQRRGIVEV